MSISNAELNGAPPLFPKPQVKISTPLSIAVAIALHHHAQALHQMESALALLDKITLPADRRDGICRESGLMRERMWRTENKIMNNLGGAQS